MENETIEEIVDSIINTRDFCGNEKEAAIETAKELGLTGDKLIKAIKKARFIANKRWNGFQRSAGVKEKYLF